MSSLQAGTEFVLRLPRFEGPLDLLLYLIEKNRLSIEELELCPIIDQYLEYINAVRRLNIELAAEFLDMASYLLWLKSSSLISINSGTEDSELVNPVAELKEMLAAYRGIKIAARNLNERQLLYRERFPKGRTPKVEADVSKMDITAILKAIASIRERTKQYVVSIKRDRYHIREIMGRINSMLQKKKKVSLVEVAETRVKSEIIAIFLAALELSKASIVRLVQKSIYGTIYMVRRSESFTSQNKRDPLRYK